MTTEAALAATGTSNQLRPSEDLRRPNEHGQLPHIILTTYPDLPLNQLGIDDILDINWQGVETAVQDAIVRVRHEGDLSSTTLRETIQLISLALRKLESEDARVRRFLADYPRIGIVAWVTSLFPGSMGAGIRKVISIKRNATAKITEFTVVRDRLFDARIELANEVNRCLDTLLSGESEDYRKLQEQVPRVITIRTTAESILEEIQEMEELEVKIACQGNTASGVSPKNWRRHKQLEEKMEAFCAFASEHCKREITKRPAAQVALRQLVAEIDTQCRPLELQLRAMRDARKRMLYGQAEAAFVKTADG